MLSGQETSNTTMIQALEEEAEDLEEDEVVERVPLKQVESADATVVQPVNHIHQIRRSSSANDRATMPTPQEEHQNGGDMALRPRFLQERSATIVHITPQPVDPLRVPRSKASAFLMSVMAKSKGSGVPETRNSTLEPLRPGVTNTLQYAPQPGIERGMPLRMAGRSTRRLGCQLPAGQPALLEKGIPEEARKRRVSASQEHIATVVRELQASKQQMQQQLDILHSILRFINVNERNGDGKRPALKEMVDVGIIPELASILREFRFHSDLQVCVMSILSALAEESPINAYMMSELNLKKVLQKTAVVHATQDRLVRLASNLVHAIEDSKHTVNIAAYQAEKAAKALKQSSSYTDMLVAALTANPRQLPSSASSRNEVARRFLPTSASSSEMNRLTVNKPNVGQYGDRQRQAFKLDVAPPALSAHYRLLFSQKLKKPEVLPLSDESESDDSLTMHDRPASSLSRKVLPLNLTPRSLTAAIYSSGSIFVEPSPLSKRLPYRGSFSAGGIRRKLRLPRKIQRVQTERLPPTQPLTSFNSNQPEIFPVKCLSAPVNEDIPAVGCTEENDNYMGDKGLEELGIEGKEKPVDQKEDEGEDESYEDDFDITGDDLEGDKKMLRRMDSSQLASDGELIDLLHARSDSSPHIFSTPVEVDAATTIQRYVRGTLVRRKDPQPFRPSIKSAMQANGKTPRTTNSSRSERRGSRNGRSTGKCIPLSARSYRQLRSQGSSRRDNVRIGPISQVKPVTEMSPTPSKQARTKSKASAQARANSSVRTQKPNNQLLSPSRSPQQRRFSLSKQEFTATNDIGPHKEDANTKGHPDPEALKQVQALYAEGLQHHKKNHLGLAIECYEKGLVIPGAQNFASLHVNLGSALMAQNKFSEALESFEHAKSIQPNNVKAIYNYSLALLHLDRAHEAQRLLRHILELDPTHEKATIALSHLRSPR